MFISVYLFCLFAFMARYWSSASAAVLGLCRTCRACMRDALDIGSRICVLHASAQSRLCPACPYCCRNRQLPVFIGYATWFKPKYVLMENVQASFCQLACGAGALLRSPWEGGSAHPPAPHPPAPPVCVGVGS